MKRTVPAVALVGWLFVLTGAVTLVAGLLPASGEPEAAPLSAAATPRPHSRLELAMIALVRGSAIVAGALVLAGRNWGRWLCAGWMVLHLYVAALHSWGQLAFHALMFAVLAHILFRPSAAAWFRRGGR